MKKAEQKAPSIFTMLMAIVLALGIGFMPNAQYAFADDVGSTGEGTVSTVSFPDVTDETPHKADIEWLAANGITTGFPNGNFEPLQNATRCDMAEFLYRLAGKPAYEPTADDMAAFVDVNEKTDHAKAVWWLASNGISVGWSNDDGTAEFRPYDNIARADMATFLHKLANLMGAPEPGAPEIEFADVDSSTSHVEDIIWMAATGISTGFVDKETGTVTYEPYSKIVRCDMAAFLHRTSNYIQGLPVIDEPVDPDQPGTGDESTINTDNACIGEDTPGLVSLEESINYNQLTFDESDRSTDVTISQDTVTYLHTTDYGKSVDLQIEILTPSTAEADVTPLVVWINGGGFTNSDAASNLNTRLAIAKAGYVVASVQHRTSAVSNFPAPLQDIKTAIRFMRANAEQYKFDTTKVAVAGNSSGGYYASMVGVTSNVDTIPWPNRSGEYVDTALDVGPYLDQSSAVNAVIDFYGVSDLTIIGSGLSEELEQSHHSAATTEALLLNGAAAAQKGVGVFDPSMEKKVASASPFSYICETTVPFIFFHGTADTLVSPVATKMLQNRLEDAGVYTERYVIEGAGHGGNEFQQDVITKRMTAFLDTYAHTPVSDVAPTVDYTLGTKAYAAEDLPTLDEAIAGAEQITVDPNKWVVEQARNVSFKVKNSRGTYSTLKMNLLLPTSTGDNAARPVLFCAACGGFNKSNPNAMQYLRYAERGYAVAVAEIRVVPQVTMPTPIQDGKAAIRWLRAHAGEFNLDPNCFIATGSSAGGYMGVMLGALGNTTQYSDDVQFDVGENLDQSSAVQGVIDMYGVSDLTIIGAGLENYDVHDSESNTEALWVNGTAFGPNPGGSVFDDLEKTALFSPFTYLDENDAPYLMFHGTEDVTVSPIATMELFKRCQELGIPSERYSIVGAAHGGWQMQTDEVNQIIDEFMDGIVDGTWTGGTWASEEGSEALPDAA